MLICIEGIDGSGKGTVTRLLNESLQTSGLETKLFSFPSYGRNGWSDVIGRYLNGEFGLFPIEVQAGLFALERLGFRQDINTALSEKDIVLCDRYVPSNLAYAAAMTEPKREKEIVEMLWELEYVQMCLPRPDVIVFLDMPVDHAIQNILKKQKRDYTKKLLDLLESRRELLHNVSRFYSSMNEWHPGTKFLRVDCLKNKNENKNDLKSFQEIVLEIVSFVSLKTFCKGNGNE